MLSTAELADILDVSNDRTLITFAEGATTAIEVGDLLVAGVSEQTPGGLLRRVTRIEPSGANVLVHTTSASLDDVIEEGRVGFADPLAMDDVEEFVPFIRGATLEPGGQNRTTADSSRVRFLHTLNSSLGITGEVSLALTPRLDADFSLLSLDRLVVGAEVQSQASVHLSANASYSGNATVEIGQLVFRPRVRFIGVVPIVYRPVVTLTMTFNGQADAGVTATAAYTATADEAMVWEAGEGWSHVSDFDGEPTFSIDPHARAGIRSSLRARVDLLFYDVAGPYVAPEVYHEASVTLTGACARWESEAGFLLKSGVGLTQIFSREARDWEFPEVELATFPLARGEAGCNPGPGDAAIYDISITDMRPSTVLDRVCNENGGVGSPLIAGSFRYRNLNIRDTGQPPLSNHPLMMIHYNPESGGIGVIGLEASFDTTDPETYVLGGGWILDPITSLDYHTTAVRGEGSHQAGAIYFTACVGGGEAGYNNYVNNIYRPSIDESRIWVFETDIASATHSIRYPVTRTWESP